MSESNESLYHYCSIDVFHKIVSHRTVRLSLMTQSNDFKEGQVFWGAFQNAANEYLDATSEERKAIFDFLQDPQERLEGYALCLSSNSDLLSQWRGYGEDGTGFAIGFKSAALDQFCREVPSVKLSRIEYEPDAQMAIAKQHFEGILNSLRNSRREAKDDSRNEMVVTQHLRRQGRNALLIARDHQLPGLLFGFKLEGFREENEHRLELIWSRGPRQVESLPRLKGPLFAPRGRRLSPYLELELDPQWVTEILIGPKNETPDWIVKTMLDHNQLGHTKLTRSALTYR